MIHDYYLYYLYYLSKKPPKSFQDWDKEKENSFNKQKKKQEWRRKDEKEKYKLWLEKVFIKPLATSKSEIQSKLREDKNIEDFYPTPKDLEKLPKNSVLIKVSFTLKKNYMSKGEEEFQVIDNRLTENPIVRDKFTGLPMVRPSTWKGHLRFAARMVEEDEERKKEIIRRLFGAEPQENEALKGRLYFFPTFFKDKPKRDVITPLSRRTRTPARGAIPLEVMKTKSKGEFYLLYIPYPRGRNFKEEQIKEDLKFLAKALKLMFYTYGFSAKKTSGFGVIEELNEEDVKVYPEERRDLKDIFLILYTKINNNVNDGV